MSPGCDHCYAETFVNRFAGTKGFPNRFDRMHLRGGEFLSLPLRWQRPRRIFVNSLSDLFHKDVPDEFIARVFAVMALAPRHQFQLLTKRHGRMRSLLSSDAFRIHVLDAAYRMAVGEDPVTLPKQVAAGYLGRVTTTVALMQVPEVDAGSALPWPLPNVWLGVSVEDQERADLRIPALLATPAAVRWLSCEPLLGPVTLTHLHSRCPVHDFDGGFCTNCPERYTVDWVVVGGESGPRARPMHPAWARELRDACVGAGVAFHFKQWGEWVPESMMLHADRAPAAFLDAAGEFRPLVNGKPLAPPMARGEAMTIRRVGTHRSGRTLDGRTWDGLPGPA